MVHKVRAVAFIAGAATLAVLNVAGPASANSAPQREDVCFTGACGSATVTFESKYTAEVGMSVEDNDCDGHPARIRVIAYQYNDTTYDYYTTNGPWHVNNSGCHGGYEAWNGLTFAGGDPLLGFEVEVQDEGVNQLYSPEMYNPYW